MSRMGRFYVLGPPTQHGHEVPGLVTCVMRQTPDLQSAPFTLESLEGPVRYDSSWVPGERSTILRDGMRSVELWTGQVMWTALDLARSFTVVVMDHEYLEDRHANRRHPPSFETFIVSVLQDHQ